MEFADALGNGFGNRVMQDLRTGTEPGEFGIKAAEISVGMGAAGEAVIHRHNPLADAQSVQSQHPGPAKRARGFAVKSLHCRVGTNSILAARAPALFMQHTSLVHNGIYRV